MGNITIQGDLTGDVPGGEVGGASNLTTVGAIPYVSAAGTLNQDPTALFWDAANDRLRVGGAAGAATTSILGSVSSIAGLWMGINTTTPSLSNYSLLYSNGVNINAATGDAINFRIGNTIFGTQLTNGNWIFGTGAPTDAGYKLDVAASGASGTLRVYDQTPTTGSTKVVVRAGAGQSGNLQEWQNSAGAALAYISSGGNVVSNASVYAGASGYILWQTRTSINSPSDGVLALYNSTQSDFSRLQFGGATSSFPSLKRNGNSLDVRLADDSAYAALQAVSLQTAAQTVSQLPAAAAGNAGTISYVTDANATTIGSTVAGGGANKVLVWSNGTAWKIFAN